MSIESEWPLGTAVKPSDEFRRVFPRTKVERGTVYGYGHDYGGIIVHWDGQKVPQRRGVTPDLLVRIPDEQSEKGEN